jgi:hypothetical protein
MKVLASTLLVLVYALVSLVAVLLVGYYKGPFGALATVFFLVLYAVGAAIGIADWRRRRRLRGAR